MARQDDDTPVSLFSFQDIITSITGIMFLIVLLLLLVMFSSHLQQDSAKDDELLQKMQQEIAELKDVIYKLKLDQQSLDQAAEPLKKLSIEELLVKKRELQEQLFKLHKKSAEIQSSLNKKQNLLEMLQKDLQFLQIRYQDTLAKIRKAGTGLKNLSEANQNMEQQIQQRQRLIKYSITNRTAKTPLIAEVSGNGVILLNLADNQTVDLQTPGDPDASLEKVEKYLDSLDNRRYYLSTAVKPGGFKCAIQLLSVLKKRKFERGIEILPDDSATLIGAGKK